MLAALPSFLHAQLLAPDQPEQDACGALVICGNGFFTPYSYDGEGQAADLMMTDCGSGEGNSMWLKLVITGSGTLVFTIIPQVNADDYDFAVLNATGKNCAVLTSADVVRCNFNQNGQLPYNGTVGLSTSESQTTVFSGTIGQNFVAAIDAVAGETYLIMINNFGVNGNPSSGFNISFAGSTAIFNDQIAPKLKSVPQACFTSSEVTLQLSEEVKCGSIAANGSDFILSPSGTIVAASGVNCNSSNQGYTDQVKLVFSPALPAGVYTIKAKLGTDGNTLLDLCDNSLLLPDSLIFNVYPDNSVTNTLDTIGCGSVVYKGVTYTSSTVLNEVIQNSKGCDSVYNVTNIIVYTEPTKFTEVVGDCDTVIFRGITYLESTTLVDTFKSQQGCDSFLHIYEIYVENFEVTITADPPEPVRGDWVKFTTSGNGPDYHTTAWLPADVFPIKNSLENMIKIAKSDTVKVIAVSAQGCIDTAILYIKADSLIPIVRMPNAFSPNGDGINDGFTPVFVNKSGYTVKRFYVYNRWGQVVYSASGVKKAVWNGNYKNEDRPAETGTYYYQVDVEFVDGTKETQRGDVVLIR